MCFDDAKAYSRGLDGEMKDNNRNRKQCATCQPKLAVTVPTTMLTKLNNSSTGRRKTGKNAFGAVEKKGQATGCHNHQSHSPTPRHFSTPNGIWVLGIHLPDPCFTVFPDVDVDVAAVKDEMCNTPLDVAVGEGAEPGVVDVRRVQPRCR